MRISIFLKRRLESEPRDASFVRTAVCGQPTQGILIYYRYTQREFKLKLSTLSKVDDVKFDENGEMQLLKIDLHVKRKITSILWQLCVTLYF